MGECARMFIFLCFPYKIVPKHHWRALLVHLRSVQCFALSRYTATVDWPSQNANLVVFCLFIMQLHIADPRVFSTFIDFSLIIFVPRVSRFYEGFCLVIPFMLSTFSVQSDCLVCPYIIFPQIFIQLINHIKHSHILLFQVLYYSLQFTAKLNNSRIYCSILFIYLSFYSAVHRMMSSLAISMNYNRGPVFSPGAGTLLVCLSFNVNLPRVLFFNVIWVASIYVMFPYIGNAPTVMLWNFIGITSEVLVGVIGFCHLYENK